VIEYRLLHATDDTIMKTKLPSLRSPLAAVLPALLLVPGCATDPHTGAQSFAGVKVSDDPCAKTATVVGGVLGAVAGSLLGSQVSKSTDAKIIGGVAGAGIGAAIGYNIDQRRCALFQIAKDHNAEISVAPVVVPKGELPPAATVAAATTADAKATATPFTPGGDTATAGLSVTLRDSGRQFASGSDRLSPEAEALFRDVAAQYSYPIQSTKLGSSASSDERAAVETLKAKRILLVGHTDDVGNSHDNANLSERRAAAVARVFQQQGVAIANLYFQGAGETLPIADNHTEEGRAANRRVEIIDVSDDAAFRKFLASRRQSLQYYRSTAVADATPAGSGGNAKRVRPAAGFIDFGGVPETTLATDFAVAGTKTPVAAGVASGAGGADRPVVPTCSADRPRVSNRVKSLATQADLPMSDYVPGLYNSSWSDSVNGNLVGLTNVDVLRDGGASAQKPTLLVWKNYDPKKKIPAADFQTQPDVNVYRGSRAILYRVFVNGANGPMKCMDVLFPYTDTGETRNSNLFYDNKTAVYVTSLELKSLAGGSVH
jgi:outer membrane protein OmpA-like peptidoglycan-associated protein